MKRPTLRRLAQSRGLKLYDFGDGSLECWREAGEDSECVINVCAPTKEAAKAGLRAALEAMPQQKAQR